MASSVAAAKAGLRDYWQTTAGLRPADGVTVRSAPVAPDELAAEQLTLGDVAAPASDRVDLSGRKAETPTCTCWVQVTRPGSGEDAVDACRDRAYALRDLAAAALAADPTAAGTIGPPGFATVDSSDLSEEPVDDDGTAARRATIRFTVTWTSHVT